MNTTFENIVAYGLVLLIGFLWLATYYGRKTQWRHRFDARQKLKKLAKIEEPRDKFLFLRDVHHFTFEEMILSALKKRGYKIIRNKAYTGDGGIDGKVTIKGRMYFIQAKRYKNHITAAHVEEFAEICRCEEVGGLFVHTGKTGAKAHELAKRHDIRMISGDRLLVMFDSVR